MTGSTTTQLFQTAGGKQWTLAGTNSAGDRYFVPAHLDPAEVRRTFWAREADLTDALGPLTPVAICRCDQSDTDPYECESDDCTFAFSELNPFGSGARPINERSAEVSRKCDTCGWRTSVWHVDDGSAEAELHEHITRAHADRTSA